MMITFQSEVGPNVMMFGDVAKRMMELMGKAQTDQGVITVEQLPEAVARLKAAVEADKARHKGEKPEEGEAGAARVGLAQRAIPLIELLELSQKRGKPVLWGV